MKLSEIPENYRKAQNIEDFSVGDIVYEFGWDSYFSGTVEYVGSYVNIKWDGSLHSEGYSQGEVFFIYVQDKNQQEHNFKVGDRVEWTGDKSLSLKGVISYISNNYIDVNWCSNDQKLSKGSYGKAWWSLLKSLKEPKVAKEITLDLKLHFNLDTTGIETVLVDCVKALVSNGKYQEAKELCELLVSVQSLGKAQEKPEDDSTEGA